MFSGSYSQTHVYRPATGCLTIIISYCTQKVFIYLFEETTRNNGHVYTNTFSFENVCFSV